MFPIVKWLIINLVFLSPACDKSSNSNQELIKKNILNQTVNGLSHNQTNVLQNVTSSQAQVVKGKSEVRINVFITIVSGLYVILTILLFEKHWEYRKKMDQKREEFDAIEKRLQEKIKNEFFCIKNRQILLIEKEAEFEKKTANEAARIKKLREGLDQLARERQIGFPWLAKAHEELYQLVDKKDIGRLRHKSRPALKTAEIVKEEKRLRREAKRSPSTLLNIMRRLLRSL